MTVRTIEGNLVAPEGARFGIVASRFNESIVERLVAAAVDALLRHGARAENITVVRVPGAWELPMVARRLAASGNVDAIVALGAVIRGATPHFEYVAGAAANGLADAARASNVPISFGVLTTETVEQALERAGLKAGNKGWDAAVAAVEMVALARALDKAKL